MDELRPELTQLTKHREKPARMRRLFFSGLLLAVSATGCTGADDDAPAAKADVGPKEEPAAPRGRSVDSALASFRQGLPVVTRLEHGAASRDELVEKFIAAVERNDTAAVARMHVSRAEYAYLYFPTSIYVQEPYVQPPAIAWLLSSQSSEKGISRVMRRLGGQRLNFSEYRCTEESREGDNTFWRSCAITYRDPRDQTAVTRRLFGTIIGRDGRYKFLSYANDF